MKHSMICRADTELKSRDKELKHNMICRAGTELKSRNKDLKHHMICRAGTELKKSRDTYLKCDVVSEIAVEPCLVRFDDDVGGLAGYDVVRLVDHYPRVGQRVPVPLLPRAQQHCRRRIRSFVTVWSIRLTQRHSIWPPNKQNMELRVMRQTPPRAMDSAGPRHTVQRWMMW